MSAPWGRSKLAAPKRCSTHRFVRISHRVIECAVCNLRRIREQTDGEKIETVRESGEYIKPLKYTAEEKKAKRTMWGLPSGEMPRRR